MKYFLIIALTASSFLACQKDFTASDNITNPVTPFADDTSKIITVINYEYFNGVVSDSITKVLKNATLNGQKKLILIQTDSYSPSDTLKSIFKYNSLNQLTELKHELNNGIIQGFDRETITWVGNNVTKIQGDSAGIFKQSYNFQYGQSGPNTKIVVTKLPRISTDTSYYPNGTIQTAYKYRSEFFVDGSFQPSYSESYYHYYFDNTGTGTEVSNGWDTGKIIYQFSPTGNLNSEKTFHKGRDTAAPIFPSTNPTMNYYRDTLTQNYIRSTNDNMYFTDILKNLYGNKIYMLKSYLIGGGYILDVGLPPRDFPDYDFVFNNQSLNSAERTYVQWVNGTQMINNSGTEVRYQHFFNSQNRLISSLQFDDPSVNIISYSMKIIYP